MKMIYNFITFFFFLLSGISIANEQATLSDKEALEIAKQAYIYGYPLITMDMTRKIMTNVASPEELKGPMGQFINIREYPNATFKDVTAPNADTLYSTAWLDLSKEPYIIQLPDEKGRYYLMPMLSGWTDVFAVPGTRTTGTQAHKYAIVGPHWKGTLPKGITELKSPTNMVWILGRTYCTGTPEDYKTVHAIQNEYKLIPLSSYGKSYAPPKGTVDSSIDMNTPVRDQVNALDAPTYYKKLAELMKDNPPTKEDAPMVAKLAKLGIIPGQEFDLTKAELNIAKALHQSVKTAQTMIMAHEMKAGAHKNGWIFSTKTGNYGTDYLQRAFVSAIGLGANKSQDAIYPTTTVDKSGKKLNGANHYVMHFAKGEMPPVKGFWSLTMYNDKYFFSENVLSRYNLSSRSNFKKNSDGSIDLYIQHDSPGKEKEANWLPAPEGNFILMLRFYWPKDAIINGKWKIPAVEQAK